MDNPIIGGTVSTTFPVPTKISDLVDDMHIEETNEAVKDLLNTTELKMNKVDAFGDAEDDFEAYPSVFGVKAYGEELKSEINNSLAANIPIKISDLVDDTDVDKPLNFAQYADSSLNATYANRAIHDEQGFKFPEYYATKYENGKKLERVWQEIGSEVITEYDIAVVNGYKGTQEEWFAMATEDKEAYLAKGNNVQGKGVYCGDLTQYVELMCIVRIHSDTTSLNTTVATWFVGLSADVNTAPDDYSERMNSGYFTGYQPKLQPNKQNEIIIRSYFMDGSHLFSEHFGSDTGGFGGLVSGNIARIFEGANGRSYFPTKLEGKNTYWFASFISPSLNTKFVLPVGTTIKVYGR